MKLSFVTIIFLVASSLAIAQNTTIPWSAFSMGFAEASYQNTSVISAVGYPFVGTSGEENTSILSGFLADTAITHGEVPAYCVLVSSFQKTFGGNAQDIAYSLQDRKSTRLNSSHSRASRMPSSA